MRHLVSSVHITRVTRTLKQVLNVSTERNLNDGRLSCLLRRDEDKHVSTGLISETFQEL